MYSASEIEIACGVFLFFDCFYLLHMLNKCRTRTSYVALNFKQNGTKYGTFKLKICRKKLNVGS